MEIPKDSVNLIVSGNFYSNIVQYNLSTKEFEIVGDSLFHLNGIFTHTEGLHEYINDSTYLVEEQNVGYIWIIQNNMVVYKNILKSQHEGYHHLPNWIRIVD